MQASTSSIASRQPARMPTGSSAARTRRVRCSAVATQKRTLDFKKYQGLGNDFILVRIESEIRSIGISVVGGERWREDEDEKREVEAKRGGERSAARATAAAAARRFRCAALRSTHPPHHPSPQPTNENRSTTATAPTPASPPTRPPSSATATSASAATASSSRCRRSATPT